MRLIDRFRGSSLKWYLLGIVSTVAAGWIGGEPSSTALAPDSSAVMAAVYSANPEAIELVLAAQASERAGDSARARSAYLEAASLLSPIADYLRLRAAQLTSDSSERKRIYGAIGSSPARD